MTAGFRQRRTIRIITAMLGLLIVTIFLNAGYLYVRLNRELLGHAMYDTKGKLNLVVSFHNGQIEQNRIVSSIFREHTQRFCDLLDYGNVEALGYMVKTLATLYGIDLVLLFNERGRIVTTYPHDPGLAARPAYEKMAGSLGEGDGISTMDRALLEDQHPERAGDITSPEVLCFRSNVTLLHDTGDVYGHIVLVRFISGNSHLIETLRRLADAEVAYYSLSRQPLLASDADIGKVFPEDTRLRVKDQLFFAAYKELLDLREQPIAYLAVATREDTLVGHRNEVIRNSLLPLGATALISFIILFLLQRRVFSKIEILSAALRRVTQQHTDFGIRVPAPAPGGERACDEVETMALAFNQMMSKLEATYFQMLSARSAVETANRELEDRVRERTAELSQMYESLKTESEERQRAENERRHLEQKLQRAKKMEAIGTLAGGVAHDLNNILSGVVSYPELLLLSLPENSPLRKPLMTVQRSGQKAAAIVGDLLAMARRGVLETRVVNLNDIIKEYTVSPEFERLRQEHPSVRMEIQLESGLFNIMGSSVHLSKVVMNLVTNAFEAVLDIGGIKIKTENTYVDRPIRGYENVQEGEYVRLTVSDTGVGMDEADVEKIFEPFFTRKKMGRSGSGLGMTVVWASVMDHKGYIDIVTRKGTGTTFYLYLPITRRQSEAEPEASPLTGLCGKGESVLVIDDIEEQREIAGRMLQCLGYEVSTAVSGEEAVDVVQQRTMDLLVLDMIMFPGIDGLETYKRILALHPGQKAIIVSGYAESAKVRTAISLGAALFLKKPYSLEEMGRAVKEALSR